MKFVHLLLPLALVSSLQAADVEHGSESGITLTYSYSDAIFGVNIFHVRANGLGIMAGVRNPNSYIKGFGGVGHEYAVYWGEHRYRDLVTEGGLAYKPSEVDWILFYLGGGVLWTEVRTLHLHAQRNDFGEDFRIVESNVIDESLRSRWYPIVGFIGKVFREHRLLYQVGFDFSGIVLGIGYSI